MRKILVLLILSFYSLLAQTPLEKTSYILKSKLNSITDNSKVLVWIFFRDKGDRLNKFYTSQKNIVSELSLKRRAKTLDKSALTDYTDLPVNHDYISELQSGGFILNQISKWFNGVSGYITKKELNNILELPFIESSDIVCQFKNYHDINEPKNEINNFNTNFKPYRVDSLNYGSSLPQLQQINVPALHNLGYSGQGVTICIMDAGVSRLKHEVFSNAHIIATYDFVNHRTYIGNDSGGFGEGSHGTMTFSLIGGFMPGQLIGPAYSSNYLLAKTENTSSETPVEEDNWIAAMEWADSIGVDVTSTSLGYLAFDDSVSQFNYAWQNMDGKTARITKGAVLAARKGIVVVNSAGNEGGNPNHNTLDAPADADSIISVGAVTIAGVRSDFSSVGNTVDGRIKPDVMALGSSDYVADPSTTNNYITGSGTSFSCPLVAGVCAQLLSFDSLLTPAQVRDALRNTASQKNFPDRYMGWGIIDALGALNYVKNLSGDSNKQVGPSDYILYQNYPNPFNPDTKIKYYMPHGSLVKITLYNVLGSKVKTIYDGYSEQGDHELTLNASNLPSNVYFINLSTEGYQKTIKTTILK
ncbi:MAG: S8 family serine peptidase [Ignavibacteriaceae bacterium]|nr:S8 family serine peptidase [Ignavibacteriaceae bacterium]